MPYDRYIGIDPGKNGGIAWLTPSEDAVYAMPMPGTVKDLWECMSVIASPSCFAMIEKVHSSPQMGVKSAFTFGNGLGHLQMALHARGIPHEPVRPQDWQRALSCMTKGDKNITKNRAQGLFPNAKVTHAIADALLIAEHCRRKHGRL